MGKERRGIDWMPWNDNNEPYTDPNWYRAATLSTLLDMRAELRSIRATLDCHNTRSMPVELKKLRTVATRIDRRIGKRIRLR